MVPPVGLAVSTISRSGCADAARGTASASVVELLQVYANRGVLTFCHVPTAGANKAAAGRLKALGTTPGVPDPLVWLPGGGHFQIELKSGAGKLSVHQAAWISRMTNMGVAVTWSEPGRAGKCCCGRRRAAGRSWRRSLLIFRKGCANGRKAYRCW